MENDTKVYNITCMCRGLCRPSHHYNIPHCLASSAPDIDATTCRKDGKKEHTCEYASEQFTENSKKMTCLRNRCDFITTPCAFVTLRPNGVHMNKDFKVKLCSLEQSFFVIEPRAKKVCQAKDLAIACSKFFVT